MSAFHTLGRSVVPLSHGPEYSEVWSEYSGVVREVRRAVGLPPPLSMLWIFGEYSAILGAKPVRWCSKLENHRQACRTVFGPSVSEYYGIFGRYSKVLYSIHIHTPIIMGHVPTATYLHPSSWIMHLLPHTNTYHHGSCNNRHILTPFIMDHTPTLNSHILTPIIMDHVPTATY